jgi:hypothetical protein
MTEYRPWFRWLSQRRDGDPSPLGDWHRYADEIDRLHRRFLSTRQLYDLKQDGVSLASLVQHREAVAKLLAGEVAANRYELSPGEARLLRDDGQRRIVYWFRLTDLLVHGVVAGVIAEGMRAQLSPCLHSYRKGCSWLSAIAQFAAYVRAHRRAHADPRMRGLYVIRRDVASYTDSIPVHARSPLWPMVRACLAAAVNGPPISGTDWALIERVIRPEIRSGNVRSTLCRGVATGQPIACVIFNLYLARFDRDFDDIPGGFYARYSDDILFAHPDPDVVRSVSAQIDAALAALELTTNPLKSQDLYLTGAGRQSPQWQGTRGTTCVGYLGCRVSAAGTVSLSRKKLRSFLRDLRRRASRAAHAAQGASRDQVGRTVCAVINRVVSATPHPFQHRSTGLLRRAITDRGQLKEVDYLIARIALRAVVGDRGVRAFRTIPYRSLRREWKLASLVHLRNHWRSERGS